MNDIPRRTLLGAASAAALARPARTRAQAGAQVGAQAGAGPIKIGLVSDMAGPYRDNGGPGTRAGVELAVADFGGTLLGRPLAVMQSDGQNKPDLSSSIAREWVDAQGVSLLMDGSSSSAALAIQQVSREKKRIFIVNASVATALVGAQCSPYSFQFAANAYALTKGLADTLTRQGGDSWFIIAVDQEAGYALQASTEEFVKAAGGRITGAVRAPLATPDFASFLLQAQSSGAKVIGLCLSGADQQNCIKQAAEFGITQAGQRLATPILLESDVIATGQDACKGLLLSASFYWNMTPEARSWSQRFMARMPTPPNQNHAAAYAGALHWMEAVRAAGTLDADAVAAAMRDRPVTDFYHKDVVIQANGTVPASMYLCEVKPVAQAKERWDMFDLRGTLPSPQAFPAPGAFGCPLVHS